MRAVSALAVGLVAVVVAAAAAVAAAGLVVAVVNSSVACSAAPTQEPRSRHSLHPCWRRPEVPLAAVFHHGVSL